MRRTGVLIGVIGVFAAALALALPAAHGRETADPGITRTSILIGGTTPLSGVASAYASVARGAEAYFKYVNARGGVNGRKITYKYLDDQYNASITVQQTRQLVQQDQVFAIFNSLGTEHNLAIRDYLNSIRVPQIFAATGARTFGADFRKYPWTIGYQPSYTGETAIYGRWIQKNKKNARIAILYQNDDYGKELINGLRKGLGPMSSRIVMTQGYEGDRDGHPVPDRTPQDVACQHVHDLCDPAVQYPVVHLREPARLEAADLRQLGRQRLEPHGDRLRRRSQQASQRDDVDPIPEGSDRLHQMGGRRRHEAVPAGDEEIPPARERQRRVPRLLDGVGVQLRRGTAEGGQEPDEIRCHGRPGEARLEEESVSHPGRDGQDRSRRSLPDRAGPAHTLDGEPQGRRPLGSVRPLAAHAQLS